MCCFGCISVSVSIVPSQIHTDHFTIQYYGPAFSFYFSSSPSPFSSTSPLFATGIIDFDRGIHPNRSFSNTGRLLTLYGALVKGKSEHYRVIHEKENNTFFHFFLFCKIILFGDPSTNPLPVWNRLKIELIGLGPRRIGSILTSPIHPLTEGSRKKVGGKKKKKRKQSRISYNTTAVLPEWTKEEEGGRIPIRDLPGWRSSLSVASRIDFGHLLLLYFKLSICPFYCEMDV